MMSTKDSIFHFYLAIVIISFPSPGAPPPPPSRPDSVCQPFVGFASFCHPRIDFLAAFVGFAPPSSAPDHRIRHAGILIENVHEKARSRAQTYDGGATGARRSKTACPRAESRTEQEWKCSSTDARRHECQNYGQMIHLFPHMAASVHDHFSTMKSSPSIRPSGVIITIISSPPPLIVLITTSVTVNITASVLQLTYHFQRRSALNICKPNS